MADNFNATEATSGGTPISADDVGGVKVQRVKIQTGADGTAVDVVNGQATMANSLPVAIASNQSVLPVNQQASSRSVQVTFTRPANVTGYTAGDVVGATAARLTFPNVNKAGGGPIFVTTAQLEFDVASAPASAFRLHLYSALPASNLADNAAFDLVSGDRNSYLGYVDFAAPILFGSTAVSQATAINLQMMLPGTDVYGYLQAVGAYTPGSADAMRLTLHTVEG